MRRYQLYFVLVFIIFAVLAYRFALLDLKLLLCAARVEGSFEFVTIR